MGKLHGKVAVVIAASTDIGAGIAKALAAERASVVVNGIRLNSVGPGIVLNDFCPGRSNALSGIQVSMVFGE
jgi:hypothetical protein